MYAPFVIDFETTNKDPEKAEPVEVGLIDLTNHERFESFIKPEKPIPPETSAVHHIVDADVAEAASWKETQEWLYEVIMTRLKVNPTYTPILIAHNASYEQAILKGSLLETLPVKWVCTYKVSLIKFSIAPAFNNEALRYWLEVGNRGRAFNQGTHSAIHDCVVTGLIFKELEKHTSIEEMIEISLRPAQPPRMPFGKWRDYYWNAIPADYLKWMLRQKDMDEGVKLCAKRELDLRRN